MRTITIPTNPNHPEHARRFLQDVSVILGDDLEADYDVFPKPFPVGLPATYQGPSDKASRNITWVSNFELRKKDGTAVGMLENNKNYTFELGRRAGQLVWYNGASVEKLTTRDVGANIQVNLYQGDPPIGWAH